MPFVSAKQNKHTRSTVVRASGVGHFFLDISTRRGDSVLFFHLATKDGFSLPGCDGIFAVVRTAAIVFVDVRWT
jgi:hypothetical protein